MLFLRGETTLTVMRSFAQAPILTFVLALGLLGTYAHAQDAKADAKSRYQTCMEQIGQNPEAAFDAATHWEGLGGGHPARHCALAALIAIGHFVEAAQGLEKLADQVNADASFKAMLLVQSSRAWIGAENFARAESAADAAIGLSPKMAGAHFMRAQALGLQGNYTKAVADLTFVLNTAPGNPDALTLRGSAYRQMEKLDLALLDLDRALELSPNLIEGLLERGIVYWLLGRNDEARSDWQKLIDLAPKSPAAKSAESNLHKLNSGLDPNAPSE